MVSLLVQHGDDFGFQTFVEEEVPKAEELRVRNEVLQMAKLLFCYDKACGIKVPYRKTFIFHQTVIEA